MTLEELAWTLPNGFHDAELRRFQMDYVSRTLEMELDVWVGEMESKDRRETYRPAHLTFGSVAYLVIEPPDTRYEWLARAPIRIDFGVGVPSGVSVAIPDHPPECFAGYMYMGELNSFLHFAAESASFEWSGAEVLRR
jgi:hypothetical protein